MAAAIAARLETVPGLLVYTYEGRAGDQLPYATVDGPLELTRAGPDESEPQLGEGAAGFATGWSATYVVRLYVELVEPEEAIRNARRLLAQVVIAVDQDRSLGGMALDAGLARTTLLEEPPATEGGVQRLIWECELRALLLV